LKIIKNTRTSEGVRRGGKRKGGSEQVPVKPHGKGEERAIKPKNRA